MKNLTLQTSAKDLFMVGPAYARRLENLEIKTAEDFLHHYPFRYNDYRLVSQINKVQLGEVVTLQGKITTFANIYTRGGKKLQKMTVEDESGKVQVIFFNQTYLKKVLKPGLLISLSGKAEEFDRKPALISPDYELIKFAEQEMAHAGASRPETLHTGRLVPVYPETQGVSSKWLRSRLKPLLGQLLSKVSDWLPEPVKKNNQLVALPQAMAQIHFPSDQNQIKAARQRLGFDELFLIHLQTLLRRHEWRKKKTTYVLKAQPEYLSKFIHKLPFSLTDDQKKAIEEILADLACPRPMNRLLQGDVGCGKTVVAAVAAYAAYLSGTQVALMAPTEILACQHYETFKSLLAPLGVKIGLVTGSNKLKATSYKLTAFDILIGTHALLYDKANFVNLGLVIIDEQHRFGVEQRAKLVKKGQIPHTLIMTATPIPRTVALALYGDLDLSKIIQMPVGRLLVKTWVVGEAKRQAAYTWIGKQIKETGAQVFLVCPLIETSEVESMKDIRAVKEEFKILAQKIFPEFKLGLLHGRLKPREKEKIINDFAARKLDILVATPVVEVGIDIPGATIMVIEGAERFGLATLHQLRGRVGRSYKQSYCLLFTSGNKVNSGRLKMMEKYHNGLRLAEMDLRLRGPGQLYGTGQHGFLQLKIATFNDLELVEKTAKAAEKILPDLAKFPLLKEKLKKDTIKQIEPN